MNVSTNPAGREARFISDRTSIYLTLGVLGQFGEEVGATTRYGWAPWECQIAIDRLPLGRSEGSQSKTGNWQCDDFISKLTHT